LKIFSIIMTMIFKINKEKILNHKGKNLIIK